MKQTEQDKATERSRYDLRAEAILSSGQIERLGPDGSAGVPLPLRTPYLTYESHIRMHARPGMTFLDVCCGNGLHSFSAAREGATVIVSDIAAQNVELTRARAARSGLVLTGATADAEQLPWPDASFDVITCAGSLSYVNLDRFLGEVVRLLQPGGAFIFVDSLNHSPIYLLNRWWHFSRGHRSLSTIRRMPTMDTLQCIRRDFPDLQVSYHGIFSFLAPLLLRVLGSTRAACWLDAADRRLPWLHRYAFKVVGAGHKPSANLS